jgi:hypothetical protein
MSRPAAQTATKAVRRGRAGWTDPPVVTALLGVLVALLFNYANFAKANHWWPLGRTCSSALNTVPDRIARATAGAYEHGSGRALVVWKPPRCTGSGHIVKYIVYAYDFKTRNNLPAQNAPSTATRWVYTGLTNGQEYNFGIQAVNSVGPSRVTFTNRVLPPSTTES